MGNYAAVVLADKPVRYYRLGETSGTTALDQSTNLANGTLHGGVTVNQTGLLTADTDTCMLFNGSTGYISLPTAGLPTGAHAFTLEVWIRLRSAPGGYQAVLSIGNGVSRQNAQLAVLSTPAIKFFAWNVDPIVYTGIITPATYHVVVTYDGTTITLYVNAASVGTATDNALNLTYGNATNIGTDDATGDFYGDLLDEVAIYNTSLSLTQISNHYLAGIGAINFPTVALNTLVRDGTTTAKTRDGLSLTTKTRG